MSFSIAVVIPYYQRQPGILSRALASVTSQCDIPLESIEVVVVDDESPVAASNEIRSHSSRVNITLLRRKNGGPGAARNTALDSLASTVGFVAFLDSDDVWSPDHLARAIDALHRSGCSFYFANFLQLGATTPAFQRANRLSLGDHRAIFEDIYAYQGDMGTQILNGNVIGTSTVVYRAAQHRDLRFRPEYRRAGEDYLMWLDFWRDGATFVFRGTPCVTYKEGVNIFAGVKWGTVEHLERTRDEIRYLSAALERYPLSESARRNLRARVQERRKHYWRAVPASLRSAPSRAIKHLLGR